MTCSFILEQNYTQNVCGLDEAGRGPLAGPVVSACVFIPPEKRGLDFWALVNDSKKLTARKRDTLFDLILAHCVCGIGEASVAEIDSMNILRASLLSMKRAFEQMGGAADWVALVDGNQKPPLPCTIQTVVKGDSTSLSIAAASILAKVTRDRHMEALCRQHPGYGWAKNAGYGTAEHLQGIKINGVTEHHRRSFAPVRNALFAS